ncbi:MAG: methyltransferase domain-containing protein [Eubacterium sp.]|nr:methyltransferase domain-containing protein [Eubacterium sp.]
MNHIVADYMNKLIDNRIQPIMDGMERIRAETADLRNALEECKRELYHTKESLGEHSQILEEHGCNLRSNNQTLETYGRNLKNSNQMLEAYGRNLNNHNQALEEYGRNLKNSNQALEEYSCNLKNSNQALEEYGCNLKNNNQALEAYGQELKEYRLRMEKLPEFYVLAEKLSSQVDLLDLKVSRLKKQPEPVVGVQTMPLPDTGTAGGDTYEGIDYFDFENHFRGSREHVKRVQKMYLPYFTGCKDVIDLGCGRGEFLELLKENGIHAVGVDLYDEFAAYCVKKGLDAKCMDAAAYLQSVEETDGIFASQLVEHLQTDQVIRLCRLAYEKLKEGSYAVFETPNPTSLAIYANSFYIDPSHIKPVHPQTFTYFMQKAGFSDIQVLYTQSSTVGIQIPKASMDKNEEAFNAAMEQVQKVLFGSQDYALVARK